MTIADIGAIATAITALLVAWELRQNNRLHRADYEDAFDRQYRDLAMIIPMDAFLGIEVDITHETREAIFNYFDLCNEQIYQHSKGRVSEDVWADWSAGIRTNITKPTFASVWREVQDTGMFTYLSGFTYTGSIYQLTERS